MLAQIDEDRSRRLRVFKALPPEHGEAAHRLIAAVGMPGPRYESTASELDDVLGCEPPTATAGLRESKRSDAVRDVIARCAVTGIRSVPEWRSASPTVR